MNLDLIDDAPLEEAVFFAEVDAKFPGVVDFDWATAVGMPEPWQWDWETPLRAQLRVLGGRSDVTAWTAEAASALSAVLKEPATNHRTLLGLGEDAGELPPTVAATDGTASVTVSVEGVEGTS